MKILSLYDGISCGRVALERAGIKEDRYVAFENDKYAIQISKKNFPDIEHRGEITKDTDFSEFEGFDMVIGGSPCTYWSIAKNNRETTSNGIGFELFMHFVRAVRQTKCRYFLYENNHSIHRDIKAGISKELGVDFIMINSALVSAQQRKRCYWTNIPGITQPVDSGILLDDVLEGGVSEKEKGYCLTSSYYKGADIQSYFEKSKRQIVFEPIYLGELPKHKGLYRNKKQPSQQYRVYSVRGKRICIDAGNKANYFIDLPDGDYIIRKLTPIECERLQTLPDNYTDCVSNTQRYRCIGNGWNVDTIVHVLNHLPE